MARQHSDQKGLTLIELMIGIAVVGISSALAAPVYRNHAIGSQVEDGLRLGGHWQHAVVEYYAANGEWPSQAAIKDMAPADDDVASVAVEAGVIRITYTGGAVHPQLSGAVLTLVPYVGADNAVVWQCRRAPAPQGKLTQGAAATGTTVSAGQLPKDCAG